MKIARRPRKQIYPLSIQALRAIERRGVANHGLEDLYYTLMTVRIPTLLGFLIMIYTAVNILFALAYKIVGGLGGERTSGFWSDFFFSLQTLSTTGYGSTYPVSFGANLISSAEILLGLIITALTTGVLFARLTRTRARVMFSKHVVIREYKGQPALMFRLINERRNQISEAKIVVTISEEEEDGGVNILRRLKVLSLENDVSPIFALGWTVIHRITENSPFLGWSAQDFRQASGLMICSLSGTDDTLNMSTFARHVYGPDDFKVGFRFVDMLERTPTGRLILHYHRFHDMVPE